MQELRNEVMIEVANEFRRRKRAEDGKCTDEREADGACPICLEAFPTPSDASQHVKLTCGHAFCSPCFSTYAEYRCGSSTHIPCPCCRSNVLKPGVANRDAETAAARRRPSRRRVDRRPNAGESPPWWLAGARPVSSAAERAELSRAAGKLELRCCPSCSTPILKNGGCNHMRCPCGRSFQWDQARPVHPCRRCHYDASRSVWRRWSSCQYCTRRAKAQASVMCAAGTTAQLPILTLRATGFVAAASVTLSIATVVSVVPAAIFGPFALAYEPIRRGFYPKKDNNIGLIACSGVFLSGFAIGNMLGYDSD